VKSKSQPACCATRSNGPRTFFICSARARAWDTGKCGVSFRNDQSPVDQTLNLSLKMGPLGAVLREHPELHVTKVKAWQQRESSAWN
jgi:hypothetical protein